MPECIRIVPRHIRAFGNKNRLVLRARGRAKRHCAVSSVDIRALHVFEGKGRIGDGVVGVVLLHRNLKVLLGRRDALTTIMSQLVVMVLALGKKKKGEGFD